MYKGVIFDFFGVVSSEVAPFWFEKYFPEEDTHRIKTEVVGPADRGEISQTVLLSNLAELVKIPTEQIEEEFFSLVSIDHEMVGLIESLKGNMKIGLCSNASAPFLRKILKEYNLERLFEVVVISSEVGAVKPDAKIYQETLNKMKLAPSEVLFVDDNPKNIEGAKQVGLEGVVFKSAEQIRKILF